MSGPMVATSGASNDVRRDRRSTGQAPRRKQKFVFKLVSVATNLCQFDGKFPCFTAEFGRDFFQPCRL